MKLATTSFLQLIILSIFPAFLYSQPALEFKLQLLEPGKWGVYVKPDDTITPSLLTTTGSAQITVVMPKNFGWNNLQSIHGSWSSNAVVHGPAVNPTKTYTSFGLTNESPHIDFITGQETLLFTFKMTGQDCPGSIYLIDNSNDPFKAPNFYGSNPGNEMTAFDPIGFKVYEYKGNYAPSAWDCHDIDGDGIANALEDTNGNGIYDPSADASDLNGDNLAASTGCMKLKLQLMPDSASWGVFAKPTGSYLPSANALATGGRITIVAPKDFSFSSLQNVHGQWTLANTVASPANNPSRKYLSFELSSNADNLGLNTLEASLLFKFDRLGDCPDSLYIMRNNIPVGLLENEFNGSDPNSFTSNSFAYCGVYALKSWRCKPPSVFTGGTSPIGTTDSLDNPQTGIVKFGNHFPDGKYLNAYPNPADDYVKIVLSTQLAEGQNTLALWDLQGRKHQEILLDDLNAQLDLSSLPAGVYFITLVQNGRVIERQELVKR